mgnify:CR=1 FL=1
MNDDIEFLKYIYQNVKMAETSTLTLIKVRNKNDDIEEILKSQVREWRKITTSVKNMLKRRKIETKDINIATKIISYFGIKINLSKDDSKKEVSALMINGNNMGIEQIYKKMEELNIKSKFIKNLGERIIKIQENNNEILKKYL